MEDRIKQLLNEGVKRQTKITDADLVDDNWYVQLVNNSLEQAERTKTLGSSLGIPRVNLNLLTKMVAESNRSLNDETAAGTLDFFEKRLFYYSFDYLPFPHEIETTCHIDTVANKMVLPGTENAVGVSLNDAHTNDPSAEIEHNGNTIRLTNLYENSSTLSFTLKPDGSYNVAEFQVLSDGLNGEVVSVTDEDDTELLTSSILLSGMRMVRLYLPYTDSVLNVRINLRPSGSKNAGCIVRSVYLGRRKYESAGTLELGMEANGELEVSLGFSGEGSISMSAITDGAYKQSYNIYSDRITNISCDESFRLMFNINAGEESTPMISYLTVQAKAGIPSVLL